MRNLRLQLLALLGGISACAQAQVEIQRPPFDLTLEAYANVTAGRPGDLGPTSSGDRAGIRGDGALRGLGLFDVGHDLQAGARAVLQGEAGPAGQDGALAERSLLLLGDWGRAEIGRRMGLPDVLTGYAPNPYTFTTAEYGPHSGPNLDPGGTLPTLFLPPALAQRIDGLSGLGVSSSLFGDLSDKLLYVSPKYQGFLGSAAYAPHVDGDGQRRDLLQTALSRESYVGQDVYRIGGSYTYGGGRAGASALHSISAGAAAVLDDVWELGASASYDGATGRGSHAVPDASYGFVGSLNHNRGAWTWGGYLQWTRAPDAALPATDILRVASAGLSYRFNTSLQLYSAFYAYALDADAADTRHGTVWLCGARWTL